MKPSIQSLYAKRRLCFMFVTAQHGLSNITSNPPVEEINTFISKIFTAQRFDPEVLVITLVLLSLDLVLTAAGLHRAHA
jgi:hypothetical protein